jgi:hypothetical protein
MTQSATANENAAITIHGYFVRDNSAAGELSRTNDMTHHA